MLKRFNSATGELLRAAAALYLGFGLSDPLVKSLAPGAWEAPAALITGGAFFVVLRWLGAKSPQQGQVRTADVTSARNATAPKAVRCGKRCFLPPLSFKHTNFPTWLSSARNRVFAANDECHNSCALPSVLARN